MVPAWKAFSGVPVNPLNHYLKPKSNNMRRISTLSIALAGLFLASTAQAQNNNPTTNCTVLNAAVCDQVIADFSTDPSSQFDILGFQYQSGLGLLRVSGTTASTSYNINTPAPGYSVFNNGFVRTGFTLATGNGSNNIFANGNTVHLTLQVFNTNMALIAQCDYDLSAAGAYCFGVADADIVSGMQLRYRYTFTTTANAASNGSRLDFDNITVVSNSQAPLPVRFSRFEAKQAMSAVNLTWDVDVEQNVSHYEIERSIEGTRFTTIGTVPASGLHTYSFTDAAPLATAYYRIKSVDVDGKLGFTTIVAVRSGKSSVVIRGFMSDRNTLTVQHGSLDGARITVSAADGRLVGSRIPARGSQQTKIDLSAAQPGLYVVRYEAPDGTAETMKVVKQ